MKRIITVIALIGMLTLTASAFPSLCHADAAAETSSQSEENERSGGLWLYLLISAGAITVAGIAAALTTSRMNKNKNGANKIT